MNFDGERLPRIVVVTVRSDEQGGWVLEVDAPDLDPWQKLAYVREALEMCEDEVEALGSPDDD